MERATDTSPTRRLRALVLDDDPAALSRARRAIEPRGFTVLSAGDGDAGLALLIDELLDLDVLVVDLDLPGRDARSLAALVRGPGGERELAIVVLTAGSAAEVRAELVALGVDAVVERSAGDAALADAALAAVEARTPSSAAASPLRSARRARSDRWPSPFGALALLDA